MTAQGVVSRKEQRLCKLELSDLVARGGLRCQTCFVSTKGLFDRRKSWQASMQPVATTAAGAGSHQVMLLTCCLVSSGEPELSMTMSASCSFSTSCICAATFSVARSASMPSLFIKRFTCSHNSCICLEALDCHQDLRLLPWTRPSNCSLQRRSLQRTTRECCPCSMVCLTVQPKVLGSGLK